tara:strand:+ start:10166 stop:10324 length:159 start_codon:yes stop_codon:yes gene_type:complete
MKATTIKLTREELVIIQDLISKEKFNLMALDINNELKVVNDLNTRLRKELNK